MWILRLHLAKGIISATLIVLTIICLLNFVFIFVDEISRTNSNYDLIQAFLYVSFRSIFFIVQLFPVSLLIGSIFFLSKISQQSEITVILASGVSKLKIFLNILGIGLMIIILAMLFYEYVVPKSQQIAIGIKSKHINYKGYNKTKNGNWLLQGDSFLHIKKMYSTKNMTGITVFNFAGTNLKSIIKAKESYIDSKSNLVLLKSVKTNFNPQKVTNTKHKKITIPTNISKNILQKMQVSTKVLSSSELIKHYNFLKQNNQETKEIELELWQRLSYPVNSIIMLMLSFPFVIRSSRNSSLSKKIFAGVIFGTLYFVFCSVVEQLSLILTIPIWIPVFTPAIIFGLLSIYMYRNSHQ